MLTRRRDGFAAVVKLRFTLALIVAATVTSAAHLSAQTTPGTLRGVVTDTMGVPIGDVEVVLNELRRQVRTGANGVFQFDSVKSGTYNISARRLGYVAQGLQIVVPASGGTMVIRMIHLGQTLSSVITKAEIGGISGVIADTAFRPLKDVKVTVFGASKSVLTDSAGAFFVPVKAGSYMLRMELDGYTRQVKGVMVPENEGRKIAVWMARRTGPANHYEANELFDLNNRIIRASGVSNKYFTRGELESKDIQDMAALARHWASGPITSSCSAKVGGVPFLTIPVSLIKASEVEFVALSMPSGARGGGSRGGPCGGVGMVVWLRQ